MALWTKLKTELDRAGRAAQGAVDEGKIRLEAFRARQLADRAAQALGWALYRARREGGDIDSATYERLAGTLTNHKADVDRLENQLRAMGKKPDAPSAEQPPPPPAAPDTPSPP